MSEEPVYERNRVLHSFLSDRFFFCPKVRVLPNGVRRVLGRKFDVTEDLQPYIRESLQQEVDVDGRRLGAIERELWRNRRTDGMTASAFHRVQGSPAVSLAAGPGAAEHGRSPERGYRSGGGARDMTERVRLSPASMVILVTETWPGFHQAKAEDVKRYKPAFDQLIGAHDSLLGENAELRHLIDDAPSLEELRRAVRELDAKARVG